MQNLLDEWRAVNGSFVGWPYEVSRTGAVRHSTSLRILRHRVTYNGYKCVNLRLNGRCKTCRVHRLVASVFFDQQDDPKKNQVNHKDCNKHNNRASNLEWMTCSENHLHAYKNGCRRPHQYIEPSVVKAIRRDSGATSEVAAKLGLNWKTVLRVRNGERHSEVI